MLAGGVPPCGFTTLVHVPRPRAPNVMRERGDVELIPVRERMVAVEGANPR